MFKKGLTLLALLLLLVPASAQRPRRQLQRGTYTLDQLRWRDNCVLADPVSRTYIMVGPAGRSVMSYKSKDLIHWEGPDIIYTAPDDVWGDIKINSSRQRTAALVVGVVSADLRPAGSGKNINLVCTLEYLKESI
jgi:hypothetical protein